MVVELFLYTPDPCPDCERVGIPGTTCFAAGHTEALPSYLIEIARQSKRPGDLAVNLLFSLDMTGRERNRWPALSGRSNL